jgi:hypothetical protein
MTKTIKVSELKEEINRILSLKNIDDQEKKALCIILEKFLHKTRNYKGYTYNEIFTPECTQWKKENPDKEYMEFVKHEYDRTYG